MSHATIKELDSDTDSGLLAHVELPREMLSSAEGGASEACTFANL